MTKQEYQNLEILREAFLKPEELFSVSYLKNFNRQIERKWALENIAIFSRN